MGKQQNEFQAFDNTMEQLLRVPHSEIKAKLDAEKAVKQRKRKIKPSASVRAADAKD